MKRFPPWLIFVLVFVILIAVKLLFFRKKEDVKTGQGPPKSAEVAANYFIVKADSVRNEAFAPGRIGAFNQVEVVPEVAGKITALYFKEGESVNKGAILAKLNDADLQAQVGKIRSAKRLTQQKLDRLKKLLDIKGVSQEEYEMQENELRALESDESFLLAQIAKTNIVAPFDGVIGLRNVSEGSFVNATTPLVSLVQMTPLYIEFSVPERYAPVLEKGRKISFYAAQADPAKKSEAVIYAIEPAIDQSTKTIRARARYEGKANFYPGSFVNVQVDLGEVRNALFVPTQCVIPTLKGQKVFVSRSGIAKEVVVKTGMRTDESIQITEGLTPGDTVITTGLLSIKNDTKLKLIKQSSR